MKFSKNKFEALSSKRQQKKIYDWIKEIEFIWHDSTLRNENLSNLSSIIRVHNYPFLSELFVKPTLRNIQKVLVLMEREMNIKVKDQSIIIHKKDTSKKRDTFPILPLLHNLRSSFNIGSIIRTSECFGVEKLLFSGYTSLPNANKTIKSAMGAEAYIEWETHSSIEAIISNYKPKKYTIYALETAEPSTSYFDINFDFPSILMLGNEALGISSEDLQFADEIIRIPMFGYKNSLNVATAFAIVIAKMRSQWEKQIVKKRNKE